MKGGKSTITTYLKETQVKLTYIFNFLLFESEYLDSNNDLENAWRVKFPCTAVDIEVESVKMVVKIFQLRR